MSEPAGLDSFLNNQQAPQVPPAGNEPAGLNDFIKESAAKDKYGNFFQQGVHATEAFARAASLGGTDVLARALRSGAEKIGIDPDIAAPAPEELRGRQEAGPGLEALGQTAGAIALGVATGGLGLAPEAGVALKAGEAAKLAAAEGAIYGIGNTVSEAALGDPELTAQKAAMNIGLGAILGGGLGYGGAKIKSLLSPTGQIKGTLAAEVAGHEAQAKTESETTEALAKQYGLKENTQELVKAANELGAPLTEGMVSDNPWVQKFEDSLVQGAPTYAGIKKAKVYEQAYQAVEDNLTKIVGEPESGGGLSKAQFGQAMESSIASNISEENKPISDLYNAVKSETANIALSEKSLPKIADNIMKLDVVRLDPEGAAASIANRMSRSIENIKTVDDVKALRKILSDSLSPTASRNEKYIIGEIQDRLKNLEENTIKKYANNLIESHSARLASLAPEAAAEEAGIWQDKIGKLTGLLEQKRQADAAYAPFINKVKTLAKYFGKKNISGAQGAIDFITNDLTPEALANKATTKGNSEFTKFFSKNFPNENELLKQYQKSTLREAAIDARTGDFDSRKFVKNVFKLEPELRENMFSPDELRKLDAAKTYLREIPKDFNPSHTAHESAMRAFFESPAGAAIANVRDFGIDQFIKQIVKLPPEFRPNPIEAGSMLAEKLNKFSAIQKMAEKTDIEIAKGAKSIFNYGAGARAGIVTGALSAAHSFEEKTDRVAELISNPDVLAQHMSNHVVGLDKTIPNIAQGFQNSMVRFVQFLNSKIPRPPSSFMLSPKWQPSYLQKFKFEQYYSAVDNPLIVLSQVKQGRLTAESMEAVSATHPDLLQEMRTRVLKEMDQEKSMKLDYGVKLSLANFLGEPLDSSMLTPVKLANQASFSTQQNSSSQQSKPTKTGMDKIKLASKYKTETQDLESEES